MGWLSTEADWGRRRSRADVEAQISGAWRVVGAYRRDTGEQVGFARAVSDGVNFAYLADVFVIDGHRGSGLGKGLVQLMVDEGPGSGFRWTLFTGDAHGLYQRFGFAAPDDTAMVSIRAVTGRIVASLPAATCVRHKLVGVMTFRALTMGDAERVREAFTMDAAEMSRQGDVHDLDTARAYVSRMLDNPAARTLVAVDDGDSLLAFAAVSVDRANANGWVSYWSHPDARRRGITSQLVRALADRELGEGGLYRLELGYRVNNPGSAAVARAAGFVQEGLEREKFLVDGERVDVVTAARLKTDPVPDSAAPRTGRTVEG